MNYQIAYCDDMPAVGEMFAKRLVAAFQQKGIGISLTVFTSSVRLRQKIQAGCLYDALFLDVDMPEIDGIALCQWLHANGIVIPTVFLSDKDEMVYRALQVQPLRFLRKSRFEHEIVETVSAVVECIAKRDAQTVVFSDHKLTYRLPVRDILYIEILNQTLAITMPNRVLNLKYKIRDAETLLAPYGFLRIHKSYLVNYRAVFQIKKDSVLLTDQTELPLSRHRYQEVTAQFMQYHRHELLKG